jgi:hypothetical protein
MTLWFLSGGAEVRIEDCDNARATYTINSRDERALVAPMSFVLLLCF